LLDAIQPQLGTAPNFLTAWAHSPAALRTFLGLHGIASQGALPGHTAMGRHACLSEDEMANKRASCSAKARAAVAVKLARSLAERQGKVTTGGLTEAREAGYSDADIARITTHVGMNMLTNILGKDSHVADRLSAGGCARLSHAQHPWVTPCE
jgi:hypothetical protein